MPILHHGERSESARAFSVAVTKRLKARDLDALAVPESDLVSAKLIEAAAKAAWALGARRETVRSIRANRQIPVGVQNMVRNPGRRTDEQRRRGEVRIAKMRQDRKERAEARRGSRGKAVNAFLAKVGTRERPPGSNGGGIISVMEAYWGFGRVPWCGLACGYYAKKHGGVVGLRSDVAGVAAIENHALAGHQPYASWSNDISGLLPGSFLVIGGFGVHVAMKVADAPGGGARTVEGNTSFGPGGSQSNGGCIAARVRSNAEIRGGAAMNYPG